MAEELTEVGIEIYKTICEHRFTTIETKQDKLLEDVTAIRQRIFNGHAKEIDQAKIDLRDLKTEMGKKFDDLVHQKRTRWAFTKDIIIIIFGMGGFTKILIDILSK